jgi:hypothetical protein
MTFKKKLKFAGVVALSLTGLVLLTSMLPRGGTAQSWVIFSMIGLLIGLSLLFY